jgi:hypothetical protein
LRASNIKRSSSTSRQLFRFFKFPLLLYRPNARVYELICHGRGTGLKFAGEHLVREVLQ